MALSNWDVMAWHMFKPCGSEVTLIERNDGTKITAEIYKSSATLKLICGEETIAYLSTEYNYEYDDVNTSHVTFCGLEVWYKCVEDPEGVFIYVQDYTYINDKRVITVDFLGVGIYGYSDSEYVGVTDDTLNELSKWYDDIYCGKWGRSEKNYEDSEKTPKIDVRNGKRFNLGDAYFVGAENSMTDVGKAEPTVFSQIIDKM